MIERNVVSFLKDVPFFYFIPVLFQENVSLVQEESARLLPFFFFFRLFGPFYLFPG